MYSNICQKKLPSQHLQFYLPAFDAITHIIMKCIYSEAEVIIFYYPKKNMGFKNYWCCKCFSKTD